jgi:hypothetical protein
MRKIEQQMLQAIANRRDWRSSNTEVQCVTFPHGGEDIDRVYVRLHGSTIAIITPDEVDASDCGWQTQLQRVGLTLSYKSSVVWVFTRRTVFGTATNSQMNKSLSLTVAKYSLALSNPTTKGN